MRKSMQNIRLFAAKNNNKGSGVFRKKDSLVRVGKIKSNIAKFESSKSSFGFEEPVGSQISRLVKLSDRERLQKVIARSGLSSRRVAENLV